MWVLWVVARSLPHHTGDMTGDARPTTFVTGAAGFIGTALVKVLVARGHQVFGLTRSIDRLETGAGARERAMAGARLYHQT